MHLLKPENNIAHKKHSRGILDPKGIIKMTGRLIPKNAIEFFNPIDEWINEMNYNNIQSLKVVD